MGPPARIPTCKILKVLGPSEDARTDHKGILAKYGLAQVFPKKVEEEAKAYGDKVSIRDCKGRKDFRKIFTLTIDPLDARDFDDAVSLKVWKVESEIGVHIADVSHYVKPYLRFGQRSKEACKFDLSCWRSCPHAPPLPVQWHL